MRHNAVWRRWHWLLVVGVAWLALGGQSWAALRIRPATAVSSLLVFGQNVDVAGLVRHEVVVVAGSLHLAPTARVRGPVVVLGGSLTAAPGSRLGTQILVLQPVGPQGASLLLGLAGFFAAWLLSGALLFTVAAGVLALAVLTHRHIERVANLAERGPPALGQALLAGAVGLAATLALAGVGFALPGLWPASLLLLLAGLALAFTGLTGLSLALGRYVLPRFGYLRTPAWVSAAAGLTPLLGAASLPLIGWVACLFLVSLSFGLGSLVWLRQETPRLDRGVREV